MQSGTRDVFDSIASAGFLVLFPGFVVYQFAVAVGVIPPFLGGMFGAACAAFAAFALVQLAVQFQSRRNEVSLLQGSFVFFCCLFLVWTLLAGALSAHSFTAKAAMVESLGTLVIWLAVFFVGSRMKLGAAGMRAAVRMSALVLLALFVYAIVSKGSFLGPFLLFPGNDEGGASEKGAATYQGVGRSILIVGLVVAALQSRFWKQALVLTLCIACLLCLGSRAHLFGAVICCVALTLAVGLRKGQRTAAFLFVSGAIAIAYVSVEIFLETRASQILDLATSSSWQSRLELQQRAVQVIAENLFTGDFGYHHWGTFPGYAHNALSAWAGFGVVVFLGYLGLMGYALSLSAKRMLANGPVDSLWLIAFLSNFVALLLAVASEPIFASVFPAFGWGVTVNALRHEHRRKLAAHTALDIAVACAEQRIEWRPGRPAGSSTQVGN